jgi:hypothetical protein
MMFI